MLIIAHCKKAKLIVCVLARGESSSVLESLNPSGLILASEHLSIRSQSSNMSIQEWEEMDTLKVVVALENADTVFKMLYHMAKIETCEGAYMYQVDIPRTTQFELPDIPLEGVPIAALHQESLAKEGEQKLLHILKSLCKKQTR